MNTALVTGASEGIGAALTARLIENDFHVFAIARSAQKLDKLKQSLNSGRLTTVSCDLRDRSRIAEVMAGLAQTEVTLDILVNNAGVGYFKPLLGMPYDQWNETLEVNLTGAFLITQAAYPLMQRSAKPHIFNICSTASRKGFMNCGAYSASKFGLLGFTEVLREELRPSGVKVTAVIPGAVNTDFWSKAGGAFDRRQMLSPDAIAQAIINVYGQDIHTTTEEIIIKPSHGDF